MKRLLVVRLSVGVPDKSLSSTVCGENNSDYEKNFLHAFSGCESTSEFHVIHKRKWLNIVKGNKEYCNALDLLGKSLQIEDHLFDMIESMVYQSYRFLNKPNVNDVRYEKCCREKFPELSKIPQRKDESTTKHLFGRTG